MASSTTGNPTTTLATNVRQARKDLGLTQRELARKVNDIDALAVSRWERGVGRPSYENLIALCDVAGRSIAWFYTDHSDTEQAA